MMSTFGTDLLPFAFLCFGLANMTRSVGILSLIIVSLSMCKRLWGQMNCCKIYKVLVMSWCAAVMIILPTIVIQMIRPYQLQCMVKLDRTDNELAPWCLMEWPNVFVYIQQVYWNNKVGAIFDRKFEQVLSSVPMFVIFFILSGQFIWKKVMGLFGSTLLSNDKKSMNQVMRRSGSGRHFIYFAVSILLCLIFANAEINSRVASVCPIYYWLASDVISDYGSKKANGSFLGWLLVVHNISYLCINLVLFTMEVGFV